MPQIILPVPATVTTHYVIATSRPPEDLYTVVPWRVPEPFRKAAIEALKTPRLSAYTLTAEETQWRFDRFLAGESDRLRIEEATHYLVLIHQAGTTEQPFREQTARAVARALADASDGILIDPQARQVVLRDGLAANERERFRHGRPVVRRRLRRRRNRGRAGPDRVRLPAHDTAWTSPLRPAEPQDRRSAVRP